ncbi:MAG: ectonucleotide pyrophosphatase/phosphodiesterase [Cyclobacteriaceae bacterium]|nr:ectonucleotide pyrophosphatase/phosphodiesterase [Cyclobacteriaceae bacterium]
MKSIFTFFIIIFLLSSCSPNDKKEEKQEQYVILISLDGFSHEYAKKYNATNLLTLAKEGIEAKALIPPYPSKTFPSHYTIATGLYPEHHGIVGNNFYDPNFEEYYSTSNRNTVEDGKWYGGTPIWCLAKNYNVRSATYFWIGSEAEINGCRPNFYNNYDKTVSIKERMDKAIEWLQLPKNERPQLISLYFSLVDDSGHKFGPNSKETEESVKQIDIALGDLFSELDSIDLPINIIVVSDHGMYPLDQSKKVFLEDLLDWSKLDANPTDAFATIYTSSSTERDSLFTILKNKEEGRYITYKKSEVPKNLHYSNNDRIGDIVLIANAPHFFIKKSKKDYWGTHGFDPYKYSEMHGIFYAKGSALKQNQQIPAFESIHIYLLIAEILQLPYDSSKIDGKPHVLKHLLKDQF